VVDITGLRQAHDGMDEDIGLVGSCSADRQLSVSAMHGVSGLESNNLGPAELVEVKPKLGGSVFPNWSALLRLYPSLHGIPLTSEIHKVIVLQPVNGIELASHIKVLCSIEEVMDCWVLLIAAENLLGLERPVNKERAR